MRSPCAERVNTAGCDFPEFPMRSVHSACWNPGVPLVGRRFQRDALSLRGKRGGNLELGADDDVRAFHAEDLHRRARHRRTIFEATRAPTGAGPSGYAARPACESGTTPRSSCGKLLPLVPIELVGQVEQPGPSQDESSGSASRQAVKRSQRCAPAVYVPSYTGGYPTWW